MTNATKTRRTTIKKIELTRALERTTGSFKASAFREGARALIRFAERKADATRDRETDVTIYIDDIAKAKSAGFKIGLETTRQLGDLIADGMVQLKCGQVATY